jgi:hypothetical protein
MHYLRYIWVAPVYRDKCRAGEGLIIHGPLDRTYATWGEYATKYDIIEMIQVSRF